VDGLAHVVFGLLFFGDRSLLLWWLFFSAAPDLPDVLLIPRFVRNLLSRYGFRNPAREGRRITRVWKPLVRATHSVPVFLTVFFLVWFINGTPFLPLFAWLAHLGIDIFTHSRKYHPVEFLWPFSSVSFDGWAWSRPAMLVGTYVALLVLLLYELL